MYFNPGTRLGVFVWDENATGKTTLFDATEGPDEDEITLEATAVEGRESLGFTLSVKNVLLAELTRRYFESEEVRAALDGLALGAGLLSIEIGDVRGTAQMIGDRYERGNALIDVRDANTDEQLARIAAIKGTEGFLFIPVAIVVVAVALIGSKAAVDITAIKRCVPIENETAVTVKLPDGTEVTTRSTTRVHKTEER